MSWYEDGYREYDGYPYYVHNGYRYRYDPIELCHYQLVDGADNTVAYDFGIKECQAAYDECAMNRDEFNTQENQQRYFCAEAVEEDQANTSTDQYDPTPEDMDPARYQRITEFLAGKSYKDIWSAGYNGGVGNCLIYSLTGNEYNCSWIMTVNDEYYPDVEGDTCSNHAEAVGCNVGDEQDNIGCILTKAISEGQCF